MFLKKSPAGYLSIVESYYDPDKKTSRHRTLKKIGSYKALRKQGLEDPEAYAKEILDDMREHALKEKEAKTGNSYKRIGTTECVHNLGHYIVRALDRSFNLSSSIRIFAQESVSRRADPSEILQDLVVARIIDPASKSRTYMDVLPTLKDGKIPYSLDDIYSSLEFFGDNYKRIVSWYTDELKHSYGTDFATTYFDATNFYFEIDRQDDLRRKGPSKELRHDPIVGMGLLLDANLIPINMTLYPGNESEKPKLKEVLRELKRESNIESKTIRVADKGLNCAANIIDAIDAGDGYIFSKSPKTLPAKEKTWVFDMEDAQELTDHTGKIKEVVDTFYYRDPSTKQMIPIKEKRVVTLHFALRKKQLEEIDKQVEKARRLRLGEAKREEFGDCSKFVSFKPKDNKDGKVVASLNTQAIKKARQCAGYNMIVCSETTMSAQKIYEIYHRLWRIEETFRSLKSFLDARPVYLQRPNRIKGHFLVCYLSIFLIRVLQFGLFKSKFSTQEIFRFLRGLRVIEVGPRTFRNIASRSEVGDYIAQSTSLKVDKAVLDLREIKQIKELHLTPPLKLKHK